MEIESRIVQPNGTPYTVEAKSIYSADSAFWRSTMGTEITRSETLKRPFMRHAWTYACVRAVMLNLCRLTHKLYELDAKEQTLYDHPVLQLLRRPNGMMTEAVLWQAIIASLLLPSNGSDGSGGQCFLVPWDKKNDKQFDLSSGNIPDELMPFGEQFFAPWTEEKGRGKIEVKGWIFSIPNRPGSEIKFLNNEIIRIFLFNPYDILKGMSPYMAAQIAIEQDVGADLYNTRLFENDARVNGLLSTDGILSPKQAEENLGRWNEAHRGQGNAGKTAILGNGLKYQQYGLTLADMQFTEQKRWNKNEILGAYGMNKIGVGDYEQINFATIREGRKLLWYDTYIPLDELIWDAINNQFICYLDNRKYAGYSEYGEVESLRADFGETATNAGTLVQQVRLPPALACRIAGISLSSEDLKLWPYLNEPIPAAGGFPAQMPAAPESAPKSTSVGRTVIVRYTTEQLRAAADRYAQDVLDPVERKMIVDMRRYFFAQRNAMMDKIDSWAKLISPSRATPHYSEQDFADIYPVPSVELDKLLRLYKPNAKRQMELESMQIGKELETMIEWNVTDQAAIDMTNKRKVDLASIDNTTFDAVRGKVSDEVKYAFENNLSPAELAKNLKDRIFDVYDNRVSNAQTIARTEMGIVSSETRLNAFRAQGINKWQWATAIDDRVRPTHMALEGSIAVVGKQFDLAGGGMSGLRYPRDVAAPLGEIINCRCVALAYFED